MRWFTSSLEEGRRVFVRFLLWNMSGKRKETWTKNSTKNTSNIKHAKVCRKWPPGFWTLLHRGLHTKYCVCHENGPEASEVLHLPHGLIIMSETKSNDTFKTFQNNQTFDPFKMSSKFINCTCHEKWVSKPPLILSSFSHTCPMSTGHWKRRWPEHVPKVLRLPHRLDIASKTCMVLW